MSAAQPQKVSLECIGSLDNYAVSDMFSHDETTGNRCLRRIILWGGVVGNCAEGNLTRVLCASSDTLELLVYVPSQTKGGVLASPQTW